MADSDHGDHLGAAVGGSSTTSFSHLLFSDDDDSDVLGLNTGHCFGHYSSSSSTPKMLCFGGCYENEADNSNNSKKNSNQVVLLSKLATKSASQKSGLTCSDLSSTPPAATATATATATAITNNNHQKGNNNLNTAYKFNKKTSGSGEEPVHCTSTTIAKTPQRISKKAKTENPISTGHPKERREKLGERITALQQLVSPFGKTDTASVLHEAMGYIRFLQDQVQVLCSPYLQCLPESEERNGEDEPRKDLRSKGLCLIPVECTVHVASSNGADYWSPTMAMRSTQQ